MSAPRILGLYSVPRVWPVSYTHLDVYKRQDYDAAAEQVKQAELAARNAAETVDITLTAKTRSVGGLHPLTPVSYTHLTMDERTAAALLELDNEPGRPVTAKLPENGEE